VQARVAHPAATVVAGGTEAMVARNRGERPGPLLDLSRVAGLRAVDDGGPVVHLGAMVTVTRLIEELDEPLPGLAAAARTVASRQIRNRATVGVDGISHSPAESADPADAALGVEVILAAARRLAE
jgi:CO/xanthine dehydrogenase FAD-binding subunit